MWSVVADRKRVDYTSSPKFTQNIVEIFSEISPRMNTFSLTLAVLAAAILVACAFPRADNDKPKVPANPGSSEHAHKKETSGALDKVKEKVKEVKDMLKGDDKKPEGAVPPKGDKVEPAVSLTLAVLAAAILVACAFPRADNDKPKVPANPGSSEHAHKKETSGALDKVKEKVKEVKDMLKGDDKKPEGAVPPKGDKVEPAVSLTLAVLAAAILVACAFPRADNDKPKVPANPGSSEHAHKKETSGALDKVKEKVKEVKDMLKGDDKKPEGAVPPKGDKVEPAGEEKKHEKKDDKKKEEAKDEKKEEKKDEKKDEKKEEKKE